MLVLGGTRVVQADDSSAPPVLCVPAADAMGILRVLQLRPGILSQRAVTQAIAIRSTRTDYAISWNGVVAAIPRRFVDPSDRRRHPCGASVSRIVSIGDVGAVPEEYFAALGAVVAFRSRQPWPGIAVDFSDPTSELRIAALDRSLVIDASRGVEPLTLGCFSETYRVDVPSLLVRPFDSCPEAHPPTGLPRFGDLPPPAPQGRRAGSGRFTER